MAKTILTVDDSASIRQMVSFTLKSAGYDVVEASSAEEALKLVGDLKTKLGFDVNPAARAPADATEKRFDLSEIADVGRFAEDALVEIGAHVEHFSLTVAEQGTKGVVVSRPHFYNFG